MSGRVQGAAMPAVSRFQAAALGSRIFIHTHRSTGSLLVLETGGPAPQLRELPYSSPAAPSSRCLLRVPAQLPAVPGPG